MMIAASCLYEMLVFLRNLKCYLPIIYAFLEFGDCLVTTILRYNEYEMYNTFQWAETFKDLLFVSDFYSVKTQEYFRSNLTKFTHFNLTYFNCCLLKWNHSKTNVSRNVWHQFFPPSKFDRKHWLELIFFSRLLILHLPFGYMPLYNWWIVTDNWVSVP